VWGLESLALTESNNYSIILGKVLIEKERIKSGAVKAI